MSVDPAIFSPQRVALVGASERVIWTHVVLASFASYEFAGELFAINREGVDVRGVRGFTSCQAIPGGIDSAYVMVPLHAVEAAIEDVIRAGARMAVVLTSGFAELGGEGAVLQDRLVQRAREAGLTIFGPNSLGFANIARRQPLTTLQLRLPSIAGGVAIISQSGATANELLDVAHRHQVGLSFVAATGNEAMVGLPDLIDHLVDQPETKVIGVYLETIRDAARLGEAAHRAAASGKPVIVLKVGSAPLTASIAAAHTGALVGDDRVFDAACERFAMVRVKTVEELVLTCHFLADNPQATSNQIAVVSVSGGACAMIADRAADAGVELPPFAASTIERLTEVLPAFATPMNPLDLTGAATTDPELFARAIEIVGADPSVTAVYTIFPIPGETPPRLNAFPAIGRGLAAAGTPGGVWTQSLQPVTSFAADLLRESGVPFVLNGIEYGLRSIRNAASWHERRARLRDSREKIAGAGPTKARPQGERATLEYLATCGVPVIPAALATTREQASAAAAHGAPVVLKVASPDIAHKTEVGGVLLNVAGSAAAGDAYDQIVASVTAAAPHAAIDGVIVSPMRRGGIELIVGVARDPFWGPVLAIGMGGVLVEILDDSALTLLPADAADIKRLLGSLKGARLFSGYRGADHVDLDRLAAAIAAIGEAALALGPNMSALEVNPLRVAGSEVEALDALVLYGDAATGAREPS